MNEKAIVVALALGALCIVCVVIAVIVAIFFGRELRAEGRAKLGAGGPEAAASVAVRGKPRRDTPRE